MLDKYAILLVDLRIGHALAGTPPVHDLAEQPRLAVSPATDHQAVRPGLLERPRAVLDGADVAVDDHRDGHGVLDPAHEGPIGLPLVHLVAGAAVDGNHPDPKILGNVRQFGRIEAGMVPAHAHLEQ